MAPALTRRRFLAGLTASAWASLAGSPSTAAREPHGAELLAELAATMAKVPAPGGAMAVRFVDGGHWSGASGQIDIAARLAAEAGSRFRIWSISKTMTAAVLLQLVQEGRVTLDDPLSRWFPDFPASAGITLRQLLSHTSGIPDYFTTPEVIAGWHRPWTAEAMIAVAARLPRRFEPAQGWLYSNTNYVLAGRIIEQVTRTPLAELLRSRLFDPLKLANTFAWGEEPIGGGFARGYEGNGAKGFTDVTEKVHPSVVWATGGIVSTVEDLRAWCHALFEGEVLSAELRHQLREPVRLRDGSVTRWGLGVAVTDTPYGTLLGHGGGPLRGNTGAMGYLPEKNLMVTTLVNGSSRRSVIIVGAAGWKTLVAR